MDLVALKVQEGKHKKKEKDKTLIREARVLSDLKGENGFPALKGIFRNKG
jgi:hypothetical protein